MEKSLDEGGVTKSPPISTAEFEKVMVNIGFDPALSSFKGEYAKLLSVLKDSLHQEKSLVKKINQLNEEIVQNASRVTQALRLAEEDGATIDDLRKQVEKAWGLVEAGGIRADAAEQSVERLSGEVTELKEKLSQINDVLGGNTVEEIAAAKDLLNSRLEAATRSLTLEKARSDGLVVELAARNERLKEKKVENKELRSIISGKEAEESKIMRQMTNLQGDADRRADEMQEKMQALHAAASREEDLKATIERLEKTVSEERASAAGTLRDMAELKKQTAKGRNEVRDALEREANAEMQRKSLEKELFEVKGILASERKALAKVSASLEASAKELAMAKSRGDASSLELEKFRHDMVSLTKSFTSEQLRLAEKERVAGKLDKEKAAALASVAVEKARKGEVELEVVAKDREIGELNKALAVAHHDMNVLKQVMSSVEASLQREKTSFARLQRELEDVKEDVAVRAAQIIEMRENEAKLTVKLRTLQQDYDNMRVERNRWKGSVEVLGEDVKELKRKEGVVLAQLGQLKDEVVAKDKRLVSEQFEVNSLQKKLNSRVSECEKLRQLIEYAGDNLKARGAEVERYRSTLEKADEENLAQKRAYDVILVERDSIASELTQRNNEKALERDRMAVMQAALEKGSREYEVKLREVKVLTTKVGGKGTITGT